MFPLKKNCKYIHPQHFKEWRKKAPGAQKTALSVPYQGAWCTKDRTTLKTVRTRQMATVN